ncbi:MAG: hypothetical protein ACRD4Q_02770 [Candidatus Acidiferrales bacterium]
MAKQSNAMRWIIGIGVIVLLAVLARSSFQQTQQEYEVCMTFKNATHCANASGATYAQAVRSAQEIDCQLLANGRDETMVCLDTQPASIRASKK